jgi:exosome complex RNA-binding protein Csl4
MDVTSENRLAIHYRRSVRVLKKEALVDEKSKRMHSFMTLAPTSSNTAMSFTISHQMKFCPNLVELVLTKVQKTAQQMVVVVVEKIFGKKATVQIDFLKSHMVISQILNTLKEKNCTELLFKNSSNPF